MNYIGREVTHNKYGKGKIIGQDNEYISVRFSSTNQTKRFNYPECFRKHLSLDKANQPKTENTEKQEPTLSSPDVDDIEQKIRREEYAIRNSTDNSGRGRKTNSASVSLYSSFDDFCSSQENLIIREIAYLRSTGGKRTKILDGKLVESKDGRYIYSFESDSELNYPDNTQITLWPSGFTDGVSATIINCEEFTVVVACELYLGNSIPVIEFSAEPWRLLNYLIERLRRLKDNPSPIARELVCEGRNMIHPRLSMDKGQETAIKMSLTQPITFVWGPPGTGKTETLARIAMNHMVNGNRVLMLSYSNVSVDGAIKRVFEKDPVPVAGKYVRYGYPKDRFLLEHDYLTSYNLALKTHPDLLKEKIKLIEERKHLSRSTPRYVEIGQRLIQIRKNLDEEEKNAVDRAKFVATTVSKAIADKTIYDGEFDTVIFDEASMAYVPQVVFSAGLVKRRFICMGDFKQLPPIVQNENAAALNADIFRYCGITEAVENGYGHEWLCMLDTQYRMHPAIALFSSKNMYHNLLKSGTGMGLKRQEIVKSIPFAGNPLYMVDLSGMLSICTRTADNSRVNILSAIISMGLAVKAAEKYEVGIIAPYSAQSRLLHSMSRDVAEQDPGLKQVSCATVHQFQGSEKDVIIYDAVDCYRMAYPGALITSQSNNYANRLYNVALTRAKGKMISVANIDYLKNKNLSKDLIFRKYIDELSSSKRTAKGNDIVKEISSSIIRIFEIFDGETEFLKDISSAKKEILIDIPDGTSSSDEFCNKLVRSISDLKSHGIKAVIRTNNKNEIPSVIRDIAIENQYITNPVAIIDKEIAWYGMPSSKSDFFVEDKKIPTQYRLIARFKGKHFSQSLYGLMEMNRTIDNSEEKIEKNEGKYNTFASYVRGEMKCSKCGSSLQLRKSKSGKFFLGCSNYPNCDNTEQLNKEMVEEYFYLYDKLGKRCPQCKTSLEAKSGPYGIYVSCCGSKKHFYKLDEV